MESPDLDRKVRSIVSEYLDAWKAAYSDLEDLDSAEREDLLNVIQDELGTALDPEDADELLTKSDLDVDDIVHALEGGVTLY